MVAKLPRPEKYRDWQAWAKDFHAEVERELNRIEPGNNTVFPVFDNLTTDRTLDADATSISEIADVLGTLIKALKATRIIK